MGTSKSFSGIYVWNKVLLPNGADEEDEDGALIQRNFRNQDGEDCEADRLHHPHFPFL